MKVGRIAVAEAVGAILGHTLRVPGSVLKKGRVLSAEDVAVLASAGQSEVFAARLEADDVGEDEAAQAVGQAVRGPGVRVDQAFTGRCNLFAEASGLAVVDGARIDALNAMDESITLATVLPYTQVQAGDMVATVKIIPFAAPRTVVAACVAQAAGGLVSVAEFRACSAGMVLTRLPGVKDSQLDRAVDNMRARLSALGSELAEELRCEHTPEAIAAAVAALRGRGRWPVLILGASAIVDRHDVVPEGIERAGGLVEHFGMPVDPGNLLLLARCGDTPVIGVPGCARSLKASGFDWVLARLLAGVPITGREIAGMGVGGLLAEVASRPQPRLALPAQRGRPVVAALVMAAGRSQRMGATNKLLAEVHGAPMVVRVVDALLASPVARIIVVTGHERERVEAALAGRAVSFVHNPEHAQGMSTSLRVGIRALGADVDAALVCLGDMPWVQPRHVEALLAAYNPVEGREICIPLYQGKRGNPVLFAARFFDEMCRIAGDVGARELIQAHADVVHAVPVVDSGVIVDVDTIEALDAVRTRPPVPED